MTLNIIIRGFLYRENWIPLSSARNKYSNYTQDFRKLIKYYKNFFNKLSEKYKLFIIFTTYDNTPEHIKQIIYENGWNLFLIKEKHSNQFTSVCSFFERYHTKNINIVIRSDLVLKPSLIELLYNYDYYNSTNITVLSIQPNCKLNDVLMIIPPPYVSNIINLLKHAKDAHFMHKKLEIKILTKETWVVQHKNNYYEIFRG